MQPQLIAVRLIKVKDNGDKLVLFQVHQAVGIFLIDDDLRCRGLYLTRRRVRSVIVMGIADGESSIFRIMDILSCPYIIALGRRAKNVQAGLEAAAVHRPAIVAVRVCIDFHVKQVFSGRSVRAYLEAHDTGDLVARV